MGFIQVFVVMNTINESFEVTKWYNTQEFGGNKTKMMDNLIMISRKLYSVVTKKEIEDHNHMIGCGSEYPVSIKNENSITDKISYIWYYGKCLDEERLSYFFPKKTLEEGEISLEEIRYKNI